MNRIQIIEISKEKIEISREEKTDFRQKEKEDIRQETKTNLSKEDKKKRPIAKSEDSKKGKDGLIMIKFDKTEMKEKDGPIMIKVADRTEMIMKDSEENTDDYERVNRNI